MENCCSSRLNYSNSFKLCISSKNDGLNLKWENTNIGFGDIKEGVVIKFLLNKYKIINKDKKAASDLKLQLKNVKILKKKISISIKLIDNSFQISCKCFQNIKFK